MQVALIREADVDAALDVALRALLSTCFTKPQDVVFRERRWFREPPARRWLVRDAAGVAIANVSLHDKAVSVAGREIRIGGVAEVCVHPGHRGRGWVRALLADVHAWLRGEQVPFAVLFGSPDVYGSSGYRLVPNLLVRDDTTGEWIPTPHGQAVALGSEPWPDGEVRLVGPRF